MPYRASLLPDIRTLLRSFTYSTLVAKVRGVRRNIGERR
jgi:hypothetical protein